VELGLLGAERARTVAGDFAAREGERGALMITPAVLEIIAVRG